MLSLAFSPAVLELGRRTNVDLIVTNTGDGNLYAVRLRARFPPWLRAHEGIPKIDVPRIEAGAEISHPLILTADDRTAAGGAVSFPIVRFKDESGAISSQSTSVELGVVDGKPQTGRIVSELDLGPATAGRWVKTRLRLSTADHLGAATIRLAFSGEVNYSGPTRLEAEAGAIYELEGSLRFNAAGEAVPLVLDLTCTTMAGDYWETQIQEYVMVGDSAQGDGQQNVYNIGKVEGNVGPGGSFTQNNVGGTVGRSSSDSIGNADPALSAALHELLAMPELHEPDNLEDRAVIEGFTRGEVEAASAGSAVRRLLDRTASVRSGLIARGLYDVIKAFAQSQI